jgi:DNA-binding NarL/FixJ family response regulator
MEPIKRIVIADSHFMIRRGLRVLLETRSDLEVVAEAATGREALDAARRTQPDVAIIDYALPELNGYLLCLQLRKAAPKAQILIYTMVDDDRTIRDALEAGASGFILKSDAEKHLFAAIGALGEGDVYFSAAVSSILRATGPRNGPDERAPRPTAREQEIVQLVAEGKQNKQVARCLGLSVKTVETHRATIMRKLKLHSTAELVRYALRHNIVATQ